MNKNAKSECRCSEDAKTPSGTCKEHGKYMAKSAIARRKRIAWLVFGLIISTAAMVAFVHYDQMTYMLGMAFNAPIAAVLGYNMK